MPLEGSAELSELAGDRLGCYRAEQVQHARSDPSVYAALAASLLAALPEQGVQQLLTDAIRLAVPAGAVLYREGESPRLALVLSGLIRIYLTAPDGRQPYCSRTDS